MLGFLVAIFFISIGHCLIMPMTKPDGSVDLVSLMSHVALLEQMIESKDTSAEMSVVKSQLKTALDELKEVKADLKSAQTEIAILQDHIRSPQTSGSNSNHDAGISALKAEVIALKSQCFCNITTPTRGQPSVDIQNIQTDVSSLKAEMEQLKTHRNSSTKSGGGAATFTRWGRTVCPLGNKEVYKGYAAGSYYSTAGPKQLLCLPEHPVYAEFTPGNQGQYIYGAEYETSKYTGNHFKNLQDEDVPCVVCESETKKSAIMVPARNQCYPGWNLEYWGYLMGGFGNGGADYVCIDNNPESIIGGQSDVNGQLLYLIETYCGPLPCPFYEAGKELTCAVCSL